MGHSQGFAEFAAANRVSVAANAAARGESIARQNCRWQERYLSKGFRQKDSGDQRNKNHQINDSAILVCLSDDFNHIFHTADWDFGG